MAAASHTEEVDRLNMVKQKLVLALCCAVALALSGCSRQQSDWQKTREADTVDAYEQFLKKYPSGEFTAQAQARAKGLYEERDWQKARDTDTPEAYQVFIKQYPEGKWTEEARIRVENFTLAQTPSSTSTPSGGAASGAPAGVAAGAVAGAAAGNLASSTAANTAPVAVPAPAAKRAATSASAATSAKPIRTAAQGSYRVQLGAFKSGADAAKQHWADLQQEYPKLLAGLSSKVIPKTTADGNLYRLLATGLTAKHAREICGALKAKSEPCIVVPPAKG